jgi:putative peptide zinc metalloprotease protein
LATCPAQVADQASWQHIRAFPMELALAPQNERRKQVRLMVRADLDITEQKYEGKRCYVVKDPVSLRYYRFNDQEYFVLRMFDGKHTMEEAQKDFEKEFRPHRLTHEDLESFARQLLNAGLVQHESSRAAEELLESRKKQRRMQRLATITNILYIKIPVIDPDRILNYMHSRLFWIFSWWFLFASVALMLSAAGLVTTHYQTFYDKLPYYHEFFAFQTVLYMWISLGIVKVIHEFGHGLSCKAYGGECHEMGFLLMCFSPALYCNVSDSWTLPNKWKRIIISFAGIYVELVIASIATWVWWYTPGRPFINNLSLCIMTLCSVSTFVFNANPLMKFDGYYMLADWLEIPNLRDRANRYLGNQFKEQALGIEVQPEPYMALNRRILFVFYAIVSYIYRWVITFSIIYTLSNFLKPYKLGTLSKMLAIAALASMLGWPMYRMFKNFKQRGRLPDMKSGRVMVTASIAFLITLAFFLLPLPISRVKDKGLTEPSSATSEKMFIKNFKGATLKEVRVENGEFVDKGRLLAVFYSDELETQRAQWQFQARAQRTQAGKLKDEARNAATVQDRNRYEQWIADADREAQHAEANERQFAEQIEQLNIRAPRSGIVMGLPRKEEIGRFWDEKDIQSRPVCEVGDPRRLKVVVPVAPYDYDLLRRNLDEKGELSVSIRAPGTDFHVYHGRLKELPNGDAKTVPQQLTFRGGGSLAVKPGSSPNAFEPQSQVYLVEVEIDDPDQRIQPGVLPIVKIHCRWRSAAWWAWRAIHISFDMNM